jgi:hypothetical protein
LVSLPQNANLCLNSFEDVANTQLVPVSLINQILDFFFKSEEEPSSARRDLSSTPTIFKQLGLLLLGGVLIFGVLVLVFLCRFFRNKVSL